mgnify:CR=1 FL=1
MKTLGGAVDPADVEAEEPFSGFYKIGHAHVGPFDHECFKLVCTQMLAESGAKLLLHTQFIDVLQENGRITGVVAANKSGLFLFRAKVVIDCSGDADVATRSGVNLNLGAWRTAICSQPRCFPCRQCGYAPPQRRTFGNTGMKYARFTGLSAG